MKQRKHEPTPIIDIDTSTIIEGNALHVVASLPSNFFQAVITSPPYWGLRDYEMEGQIGLEPTFDQFINHLVAVFSEVKRVLRDDGTLWINVGDGYTSGNRGYRAPDKKNPARAMSTRPDTPNGLKRKDLIGIPWRLAFELQRDGWYLRSDIVWHKPNSMPESVKDRPSRAHEYLFLLSKSEHYFFDNSVFIDDSGKKRRSVWTVSTESVNEGHFATFPVKLIEPCIQASTRTGDYVLDPFFGSGTVGIGSINHQREFVGIELNPDYVNIANNRISNNENKVLKFVA